MKLNKAWLYRTLDTRILMVSKYFPKYKRDITLINTKLAVHNFFILGIRLSLWKSDNVNIRQIDRLAKDLFKMVSRRHTHIWKKDKDGNYLVDQWDPPQNI